MNNIIPSFYYKNKQVTNIITSMNTEAELIEKTIDEILLQLYVDTATWGLDSWEKLLDLRVDKSEDIENRRARIKMRIRGTGVFNKQMIMSLCKSFANGDVCVIENNADNSFIIKFTDVKGIPSNIEYLRDAIEEVKPAHLNFSFQYLYTICQNYIDWKVTCNEMLELICDDLKTYERKEK